MDEKEQLLQSIKKRLVDIKKLEKKKKEITNNAITIAIQNKINENKTKIEETRQNYEQELKDSDILKEEYEKKMNERIDLEKLLEKEKKLKNKNFEGEKEGIAKLKDALVVKQREYEKKEKELNKEKDLIKKYNKEIGEIEKKIRILKERIEKKKNNN